MEKLRDYDISVWTLQDSFITVLKHSNLEHEGQIIDPEMTLKDDGENKLSLKIPMYTKDEFGNFKENPLWCNVINGTIIADLRKIKVIFNKTTPDEEIYEFIILKVKESHEGKKKYCSIECEGLAFHELGRQGYKIALEGEDELLAVQEETGVLPMPTINYWVNRVLENSNWHYSVQMDWSAHDGITHQTYTTSSGKILDSDDYASFTEDEKNNFNIQRSQNGLRRRDRIYKDSFVSSWSYNSEENRLIPKEIQEETEMYRYIEAKESNRYNLCQTIAERFQVFCKYKYYYDDNYHIIDREVIFYNNFLNESAGFIDLTYKYNTDNLVREMDSSDVVTKMYVTPLKDDDMPAGEIAIRDCLGNRSLEDYILNFDYLYNIGTISQEQYDEIEEFEKKMHELNIAIDENNRNIKIYEEERDHQEALLEHAEAARAADQEGFNDNNNLIRQLTQTDTNPDGIVVNNINPQTYWLIPSGSGGYYCNISTDGINVNTLKLYWSYETRNHTLSDPVAGSFGFEYDDKTGKNLKKITNISKAGHEDKICVYATFTYRPATAYDNLIDYYSTRISQDDTQITLATQALARINSALEGWYAIQKARAAEKQRLINQFERFMGPALREGTWKPEDEYADYGESHETTLALNYNSSFTSELASLGWDEELFEDEDQNIEFKYGLVLETCYYPCIRITADMLSYFGNTDFFTRLNFIYTSSDVPIQSSNNYLAINSMMRVGFVRSGGGSAIPVLILVDSSKIEDTTALERMAQGHLAVTSVNIDTNTIEESKVYSSIQWVISPTQMRTASSYKSVFPRLRINSNIVKSPYTEIKVSYAGNELAIYSDFYVMKRIDEWYVTLKPHAVFNPSYFYVSGSKAFTFNFITSTAATAIYLDGIEVMKENSFPKVSYEIKVISVNKDFIYNDYNRLGQIAHINDYELKFNNTMGYISQLDLKLDKPWEDTVTIKNYKTKFEDLFSTIVAQTEQMKKNSLTIGLAANAFRTDGTLNESLLAEAINAIQNSLNSVAIPTPESEYLKYEPFIRSLLRQIYVEAGEVLSAAQKSVDDVAQLNVVNADILALYKENIKENLTPTNFKLGSFSNGVTYNKRYNADLNKYDAIDFKVGDILEYGIKNGNVYSINTYLATENSHQVEYVSGEDKLTSLKGWSLVQDGSLAQIKGANLDIDAKAGKIQILAENEINIASGGLLKLAGQDVKIIGNKTVEIGGPDVKIYSANAGETVNTNRGIHIYSSVLGASASTSAVDITGSGIVVGSAGKIDIKSAAGINIYTSDTSSVSAIRINRNEGVYIGSNKEIRFYSGGIASDGSGASALISKDRILFGVNSGSTGTAVDLTKDYIVFGVGDVTANHSNIGTKAGAAGIQINQTSIKMATGTANTSTRNYINMDSSGVVIANATNETNGAIVKISNSGVLIGTASKKTTFTDKIKSNQSATDTTTAKFQVYAPNFVVDENGNLYAYNAYISGTIYSGAGKIGGWYIGEDHIGSGATIGSSAIGMSLNGTNNKAFWAGTDSFYVTKDGQLHATSVAITGGTITINGQNANFAVGSNGQLEANGVDVSGAITATSLHIKSKDGNTTNEFYDYLGGLKSTLQERITTVDGRVSNAETLIEQTARGIRLEVSNTYETKDRVDDVVNGTDSVQKIKVTGITLEPNKLTLSSTGNLQIDSGNFRVASNGNVSMTGEVHAQTGSIGGWYIGSNYIGNNNTLDGSTIGLSSSTYSFWSGGAPRTQESIPSDITININTGDDDNEDAESSSSISEGASTPLFSVTNRGLITCNKANFINTHIKSAIITEGLSVTGNSSFRGSKIRFGSDLGILDPNYSPNYGTITIGQSIKIRSYGTDPSGDTKKGLIYMKGSQISLKGNVKLEGNISLLAKNNNFIINIPGFSNNFQCYALPANNNYNFMPYYSQRIDNSNRFLIIKATKTTKDFITGQHEVTKEDGTKETVNEFTQGYLCEIYWMG